MTKGHPYLHSEGAKKSASDFGKEALGAWAAKDTPLFFVVGMSFLENALCKSGCPLVTSNVR